MDEAHNKLLERLRTYYGDDLACRTLLMDARHALEALAGEVGSLKRERLTLQNAGVTLLERAEAAEAERDRLKAEYDAYRETSCESISCLKAALEAMTADRDRLAGSLEMLDEALGDAS